MADSGTSVLGRGWSRARWTEWAGVAVAAICLLLLLQPLGRFIESASAWLGYPYPRFGSEGLILYESLLVKRGGDIYSPITPDSFISGPYPPVYYWLAATVIPDQLPDFSGPDTPDSIFRNGRTISLLAALLTAALIPLIVVYQGYHNRSRQRLTVAVLSGLVGSLLFLSLPQTMVWATRFRGDMLMLLLTAVGLLCIALGNRAKATPDPTSRITFHISLPTLVIGALFFSLAFYTKQTALAGPVASAAYLLLRDWRVGLRWCLIMGGMVLLPFLALDVATGHWFFLKMVSYHSLRLSEVTLTRLLQFAFWEDQWPLILLAAGYVGLRLVRIAKGMRSQEARQAPSLVAIFTLAAFLFIPTGAVIGADHNHLLMSGLAIAMSVGAGLAWAGTSLVGSGNLMPAGASLAGLLLLVGVYAAATSPPSTWYDPDLTVPAAEVQEQYRRIIYNVSQNPGTHFFSDDPGIVALAGKATNYDDPFTMTALAQDGRWDESAYRIMLREGNFGLLVLSCDVNAPNTCRADTFTPGVLDAIRDGYQVLFRDVLFTYTPKAAP